MTNKILLVDDEKDIVDLVEEVLQREGFQSIQKAFTGKEAVNLCQQFQPEVVVLDIMLPDMDGLEVCRKIREFSYCSILFLSSKSDDVDKILACPAAGMIISQSHSARVKWRFGSRPSFAASSIKPHSQ